MTMVVLFFVVIGLYSYRSIGVEMFPAINTPFVTVVTTYPGAGAEEIETQIVKPMEEALSSLAKVNKITAVAMEGAANVMIEFELTADADQASIEVQKRIDAFRWRLPADADDPVVIKRDMGDMPIMALALRSDRPLHETHDLATDLIKDRLQKISGVSEVTVTGGQKREIDVNIDRTKLEMYGLSLNQVINRLGAENVNQPSGRLDRPEAEYMVRVLGQFRSVDEINNLEIPLSGGGTVALRQLATVTDGLAELRQYARLDGVEAIALLVFKQSDANIVDTGTKVKEECEKLQKELPPGTELIVARDFSEYIGMAVNGTRANIIEGIISTALALLIFLRNWRSMLSVLIAIPVSLISTLAGMYFAGFTFNMLSLMGMALCIGILVDDSIVVLENIYRHLKMGKTPIQAAIDGRAEIGMAAVAITASDCVVFLPIAFMSGMIGQFFRQFGLTVVFAALMSLFVSFTLTPMLASRLLKQDNATENPLPPAGSRWSTWQIRYRRFWAPFDRFGAWFRDFYHHTLVWALGHRKTVLVAGMAAFFLALSLIPLKLVGMEYAPRTDQGEMTLSLELPIGVPIQKTDQALKEIEAYLASIPEIKHYQTTLGSTGGYGSSTSGSHLGRIGINLINKDDRDRMVWEVAEEIRGWSRDFSKGTITVTVSDTMGSGGGKPVQVEVTGPDPQNLGMVADQIKGIIARIPGSRDVDSNWRLGQPEIQVRVDRLRAAALGVSVNDIARTVRTSLSGETASVYREANKDVDIVVRLDGLNKADLDSLRNLTLTAANGTGIKLGQVAEITTGTGPTEIRRADRQRCITVQANLEGRVLNDFVQDAEKAIKAAGLPAGYSYKFVGQTEGMQESFTELVAALLLSIVLVYMVLVMLYESFLTPFIRMMALPLGIFGALFALAITGNSLNMFSMIGIIMMDGLVAKNGTLLIDYTHTVMERGRSLREALMEAGQTRLRPIMMTTLTMICGFMPTALAITEGSESRSCMAWVLIGGLLTSTLFTLVVIPVIYTLMDDAQKALGQYWRRYRTKTQDGVAL